MKILIPRPDENNHHFKANLHSHSIISDGHWTVQEVKEHYKNHGYAIVAFTDHEAFIPHNDLTDADFLALNGTELAFRELGDQHWMQKKSIHINLIATNDQMNVQPFFHHTKYFYKPKWSFKKEDLHIDESMPDVERDNTPACVNRVLEEAHRLGFLTCFNHPSETNPFYETYIDYEGFDFLELRNGVTFCLGKPDCTYVMDAYLSKGKKIYGIGSDDNHNTSAENLSSSATYRAFTIIFAKELTYPAIIAALKNGDFYTGTGDYQAESPRILSLTYDRETKRAKIITEKANRISLLTDTYYSVSETAPFGENITEAEFEVFDRAKFFRFEITDARGYKTLTNAYDIAELNGEGEREKSYK